MKQTFLTNRSIFCWAIRIFFLVAIVLAGCTAPPTQTPEVDLETIVAAKPRLAALSFETARVPQLVDGNTSLAFDLYRGLFDRESNLVYSPYSLSISLAMIYAGARDRTETQMAQALHFSMPQSQLHPAFNALDQALTQREQTQLQIANALWGSQQGTYLEPFLDTLAENYGAGVRLVDFVSSELSRQTINQWVSDETEDRISDLLPSGVIRDNTDLLLTNAVYFKADWALPFNVENTREQPFNLLDGQYVSVPMMEGIFDLFYAQVGDVKAIDLPYNNGTYSMLIILPEIDSFESTLESLDTGTLNRLVTSMAPTSVHVSVPKFNIVSTSQMKNSLMALGMVDAFGDADFSGIDGSRELFIDEVYHWAFINVDEAGTEAAGGSAVEMSRKGASVTEITFEANHPFIFLIRDVESGTVLFLGHVINPDR
jgi:serpin B